MRVLLKNVAGESPLQFYLSQTECWLRYGEFGNEPPDDFALKEELYESVDLAMDAYSKHLATRLDNGFNQVTLTSELRTQLEGEMPLERAVLARLPSISTECLESFHELLSPIFRAWPERDVSLGEWKGVLEFNVKRRNYAVLNKDDEACKTLRQNGTECIACDAKSLVLRTTSLERYVLRIVFAVMARRYGDIELMIGNMQIERLRRVGFPKPNVVGLSEEGIDQLIARMREARLFGPSTQLFAPSPNGASTTTASSLAF